MNDPDELQQESEKLEEEARKYKRAFFSGIMNTDEEIEHYFQEVRRPDALREEARIRSGIKQDNLTKILGWADIVSLGGTPNIPESEQPFYEKCRDQLALEISNWIKIGNYTGFRRLSDRVKQIEDDRTNEPSSSDAAKLKALEIVSVFLSEEKCLITEKRLLEMLYARGHKVASHRMLKEIGLNGLPGAKRGRKKGN